MHPYLQFGALTLGAFGIMMAAAFLCAWRVLELNMRRHNIPRPRADLVTVLLAGAGLIGSKLHHELETPAQLFAHPSVFFNLTQGKAWFGGLLAGIATLYLLARFYKLSPLTLMDLVSPAAAVGYAIGRLGCLLAGDGCYGAPTSMPWGMTFPQGTVPTDHYVHPTPIYEFIAGAFIFLYLWRIPSRSQLRGQIFAQYLLLTGGARFLVEFIRINPPAFYGLTSAQWISLFCLILGISLLMQKVQPHLQASKPAHLHENRFQ